MTLRRVRVALIFRVIAAAVLAAAAVVIGSGCGPAGGESNNVTAAPDAIVGGARIQTIDLSDPVRPAVHDQPVVLSAARNEWTAFAIQVTDLAGGATYTLRLRPLQLISAMGAIPVEALEPYQILPLPIDVNRASYVRHTGLTPTAGSAAFLPRALLPVPSGGGAINLQAMRDPARLSDAAARANRVTPVQVWVDVHVPADAVPGEYEASCDVMLGDRRAATVPVKLTVYDFTIPNTRHLQVVSRVGWESLVRQYPDRFEAVTPRLLNRTDDRYAGTVATLDALVALAQRHRTGVFFPRLQPTVKWPANEPPRVDWSDFDTLVTPWLKGDGLPDGVPLGFWPLPQPDYLGNFDRDSQLQYWSQAATHFDRNDWLGVAPVWVDKVTAGPVTADDGVELSARAAETLAVNRRLRAILPLQDDQLQFARPASPKLLDPASSPRLTSASPGLVFSTPPAEWKWPPGVVRPSHWLRTDTPGLVPYVGAGGDERDVRLWAWLAFVRQERERAGGAGNPDAGLTSLILWNDALPELTDPARPADPNELVWFYPGEWFGLDEPVPTIQLKWLRRAQQDYEYLWLAKERGEIISAHLMARLMTKPVKIQSGQVPDPVYALMSGTTDPQAWADVQRLLAETILLRREGEAVDKDRQHALYIETLRWQEPQERPLLIARSAHWAPEPKPVVAPGEQPEGPQGDWLGLKLGLDIYNASDNTPDRNSLRWTGLPPGWEVRPQPKEIPILETYEVLPETMVARFDLDKITPAATRQPIELTFTNGFTNRDTPVKVVLPVAGSERREGRIAIDAAMDEWDAVDAIQAGPLVRMLDRPSLQRQALQFAQTPSTIYSGWAAENFYVAFELDGIAEVQAGGAGGQNFVNYQSRRAWGEDLCELLIQPLGAADNRPGPVLHIICKPNGSVWVERKLPAGRANARQRGGAGEWQEVQAGVRYAARADGRKWRGEVAIPWRAILDVRDTFEVPRLMRFNFAQHRTESGESATWAGPVDFGRDDAFMGVISLREVDAPGMGDIVGGR